ncbi:copper amine oxidase N-terminal domain-containing protein [Ammoniphilus sp. YIM 78166]|uniref:copper amine oxidase N-terminal domain-containing protein n=1 Tax=Ammoniphilus sp. YIM 78166 TaxID=1644106 RepID=UPI00106F8F8D|nr:copper amine oxidase N-terminal domain-containing protein [Ammoniphilus sp. YIM 78166]
MKPRWLIPLLAVLFLLVEGVFAMQTIKLVVNEKEIKTDVPPQLVQGRVLVPVRSVAEALQAEVKWDELSQTVTISQKKSQPQIIAKLPEAKASLLAIERDGLYERFELQVGDQIRAFPFWASSASRPQQMLNYDIDQDGNNEIIILLSRTNESGSDSIEAHVIKTGKMLHEVYVDHPLAVTLKNVKTKIKSQDIHIRIGNKDISIPKKEIGAAKENWFSTLHFGNRISYNVLDNRLTAHISGQISPNEYVGDVVIVYEFKDLMFQAAEINFKPMSNQVEGTSPSSK